MRDGALPGWSAKEEGARDVIHEERHVQVWEVAGAGDQETQGGQAALLHQDDPELLCDEAAHGYPGHMHRLLRPHLVQQAHSICCHQLAASKLQQLMSDACMVLGLPVVPISFQKPAWCWACQWFQIFLSETYMVLGLPVVPVFANAPRAHVGIIGAHAIAAYVGPVMASTIVLMPHLAMFKMPSAWRSIEAEPGIEWPRGGQCRTPGVGRCNVIAQNGIPKGHVTWCPS